MPFTTKYKKKYTKELLNGLRSEGMTDLEVCLRWKICIRTYNSWINEIPAFAEAAEFGDMQAAAWWLENFRKGAVKGQLAMNAAMMQFGMKNTKGVKWVDKTEVHTTHDEQVRTIKIEMLPPRNETRVIEHEGSTSKLDSKPS